MLLNFRSGLPSLLMSALLAGCASPYTAPTGDGTARMCLVAPQSQLFSASMSTVIYPAGKCEGPMALASVGGVEARLTEIAPLGIPSKVKWAEHTSLERVIPAGQRSMYTTRAMVGHASCTISYSFLPEVGADYEARIIWSNTGCQIALLRIRTDNANLPNYWKVDSLHREPVCTKGL